jgi:hypothetical protein
LKSRHDNEGSESAYKQLLNLELIHSSLPKEEAAPEDNQVPYLALSSVWGKGTDPERTIPINNIPFTIKINIERALAHLEAEFDLPIWADAVCINQGDHEERESKWRK